MTQPEELKSERPLKWSTGRGTDVWEIFSACLNGHLDTVKRLLTKDPSLARCHCHYRKPLYFAVRENRLEIAALLLEHDPDPFGLAVNDRLIDIARDRGYLEMERLLEAKFAERFGASPRGEPVAAAIREHDLAKLRGLLDASPDLLHAGDARSNQPIHWAVMTRQLEFVDELVQRGADLNAQRTDGARPIHLTNGDYHFRGWRDVPKDWPTKPEEVYRHLVNHGAQVDLGMACATGDLPRVRALLDQEPALVNRLSDYSGYYVGAGAPIKNAAAGGHLEIVQLLLERGADPNLPEEGIAPDGHALHSAVVRGHLEIVKLLLKHGAHPNVEIESSADTLSAALGSAGYSTRPNPELVELLCSHGAARAVHLLAYSGDVLTAAAVFAANPALANNPEALANAASEGKESFVRLMLLYQPDLPRRVEFPGWAVGAKTRELNELLFQHGMNPSAPDWLGITPLHQFARNGDVEKATLFLDHGADLHARDEDLCSTPLGWAAKFGQKAMAELLLARGAQPTRPDDPPWATPLAWAMRRGHHEIAALLRQHGAMAEKPEDKIGSPPPLSFADAVVGLLAGDFTRLDPLFSNGADGSASPILQWYEAGLFRAQPDALKETFTCACFNGRLDVAEHLLAHGMDPAGGMSTGLNAFHWAVNRGQLEIVRLLIRHKSPLDIQNNYGGTVLGCAVWSAINEPKLAHPTIIEALLQAGAQVREAVFPTGDGQVDQILRRFGAIDKPT